MKVIEALRKLMDESEMSHYAISKRLGVTSVTITRMWKQDSVGADRLVRICDIIGWDVVLVPKGSKLPKGAIVLEEAEQ